MSFIYNTTKNVTSFLYKSSLACPYCFTGGTILLKTNENAGNMPIDKMVCLSKQNFLTLRSISIRLRKKKPLESTFLPT